MVYVRLLTQAVICEEICIVGLCIWVKQAQEKKHFDYFTRLLFWH
jgi:hypothetical protein